LEFIQFHTRIVGVDRKKKAPACFGTYTGFNLLKELYGQGHDPDPPYFPAKDRKN
jgi:hypothetical protein